MRIVYILFILESFAMVLGNCFSCSPLNLVIVGAKLSVVERNTIAIRFIFQLLLVLA